MADLPQDEFLLLFELELDFADSEHQLLAVAFEFDV